MAWSSRSLILLLSLPIATVCAALLYYLSRKDEDWEDIGVISGKSKIVEMKIPSSKVPSLIGRNGTKIKEIQDATNTRINFKDGATDDEFRICRIRGTLEDITSAQEYINDFFIKLPEQLTEELWIPQHLCGRIIGRCGETIKSISSQSNAHIVVERNGAGRDDPDGKKRQVLIRGTAQEISVAKRLILAKVEDSDKSGSGVVRNPRTAIKRKDVPHLSDLGKPDLSSDLAKPEKVSDENESQWLPESEKLQSSASENMIQVYVSAVASPTNFWVQLVNSRSVDLDHLVEDMTDYYGKEENRVANKLEKVYKGQIIAAPFATDNRWYRVEICEITEPGDDPLLDVFYVDYGDSSFHRMSQVYGLRTDFLSLWFQAIECKLADVSPVGDDWNEEAIAAFEDMLHTAQWKHVMLKMVGHEGPQSRPIVTVLDPESGYDVGEELVRRGLAVKNQPATEEPKQKDSSEKETSREDEPIDNKSTSRDTTSPGKDREIPKMYTSTPLPRNEKDTSKPEKFGYSPIPETVPEDPSPMPEVLTPERSQNGTKPKNKPLRKKKPAPTFLREPGMTMPSQPRDPWSPQSEASGNPSPQTSNKSQSLIDSERQ